MGILAAKRFKENYKASGGPYKGQGYREIANNKIKDKREFILGSNANGSKVSAGMYFYTIKSGNLVSTQKMIFLK